MFEKQKQILIIIKLIKIKVFEIKILNEMQNI